MPQHESRTASRGSRRRALPRLPKKSPGRPSEPRYREQYGLIVICPNEPMQRALYTALAAIATCKLRVVTT